MQVAAVAVESMIAESIKVGDYYDGRTIQSEEVEFVEFNKEVDALLN